MTTPTTIAEHAANESQDPGLRARLRVYLILIGTGIAVLAFFLGWAYLKDQAQSDAIAQLANEQREAVGVGEILADQLRDLGVRPRADVPAPVDDIDPNDPEIQDDERQDPEIQDGEVQDPDINDPDPNDPEAQDGEVDDPENQQDEINDPDPDDPETQDPENQDEEIQEPEIQEPEEQDAPVCSPGYTRREFVYYGQDGLPDTADDQTWELCVKDQPE